MDDLVSKIALHLSRKMPVVMEIEDLVQSGHLGMMAAEARYRPEKGASFETFANYHVRGAMLDEMRRYTWAPRSVLREAREAEVVTKPIKPISLDSCPEGVSHVASSWPTPDETCEREKMESCIRTLVSNLPSRERIAIQLTYFDGMSLAEAGECLGVTESRLCQIRRVAELAMAKGRAGIGWG